MMMSLRKLRKLFRRDSTAHMHPRKKDDELITVQRMERVLRERNISSKSFHVKVSSKNNARSFHGLVCVIIAAKL